MATLVCNGEKEKRPYSNCVRNAGSPQRHNKVVRRVRILRGAFPAGGSGNQDMQGLMKRDMVFGDYY